ncbi:MAG: solute carrier family 23 protein [Anaerolineales bacterium]|nr:solute carrier family 23 protein [Anaerolineales bacterium]
MFTRLQWSRESFVPDLTSGLAVALVSIPEGMAYALVAGVDPVYGLYTGMVTTVVASLTSSTSLMVVTLTNALALVTADALGGLGAGTDPIRAMFTLTMLVGLIMFLLGVLRLGSVIRFVSREVMSGFVFATALLIVLGQYDELVGHASSLEANKLIQAVDITLNVSSWEPSNTIVGVGSILILLVLKRTRVRKYADVLIIILASIFVYLVGWGTVELVGDIAEVPSGFAAIPTPVLPDFSAIPMLVTAAVAAAVVGLAEASGTGAAYPNPDGSKSNMSRDFSGQGLGNLVGSFFQAMPAGGSLSRTGINESGGARTRWSGVYAGVLILLVVMIFGGLAELIPMTALAAMLIVIGVEVMIKEGRELAEASRIDWLNVAVAVIVILVAVFEDLTVAIFAGVVLSLLVFAFEMATRFHIVGLVQNQEGRWEQRPTPETLQDNHVMILDIVGTTYFASVYSFDDLLPDPGSATHAVLVLRMRGRAFSSLAIIKWLENYAEKMRAAGNLLLVSGIHDSVHEVMEKTDMLEVVGPENVFRESTVLGESTNRAVAAGKAWIESEPGG